MLTWCGPEPEPWFACEHPEQPPVMALTTFHAPQECCFGCYVALKAATMQDPLGTIHCVRTGRRVYALLQLDAFEYFMKENESCL